jgi:hypothetical protein
MIPASNICYELGRRIQGLGGVGARLPVAQRTGLTAGMRRVARAEARLYRSRRSRPGPPPAGRRASEGRQDVPCRLPRLISNRFIQRPFTIWLLASVGSTEASDGRLGAARFGRIDRMHLGPIGFAG